jgi:NSS family neurotransmitter:Na+ symporter
MVELVTRLFMDAGLTRRRAVLLVGLLGFSFGIPSALDTQVLDNQDWTWGLGLLVSGFFFACAVLKYGRRAFRVSLVNGGGTRFPVGKWFEGVIGWVVPVEFVLVLAWWFWQSITVFDPEGWWNPFRVRSVATCLLQWGLVIGVFVVFNRWMARKSR